jgi:YQGE family putative transporter
LENRTEYAYIFNHEFGLFTGRLLGCGLFLAIAYGWSGNAALKYALPAIALVQLLSIRVAGQISRGLDKAGNTSPVPDFPGRVSEA